MREKQMRMLWPKRQRKEKNNMTDIEKYKIYQKRIFEKGNLISACYDHPDNYNIFKHFWAFLKKESLFDRVNKTNNLVYNEVSRICKDRNIVNCLTPPFFY